VAKQALDLGFYISFSGIVTFKNALAIQDVAKQLPLDRMLIETDAPYLAPVPMRGKKMSRLTCAIPLNLSPLCAASPSMKWQIKQRVIFHLIQGSETDSCLDQRFIYRITLYACETPQSFHFIHRHVFHDRHCTWCRGIDYVLSVMNGFDREIRERVFSMVPSVTIGSVTGYVSNWQQVQKDINSFAGVTGSAPFATGEVLLSYGGGVQAALLSGILPEQEKKITRCRQNGERQSCRLTTRTIRHILGENLAEALRANVGDKVTVVTPQVSMSPAGVIPRFKRFTVVGIFRAGSVLALTVASAYSHARCTEIIGAR